MDRIAIIGSCVTRDVWRVLGVEPENVLFISRTSLVSLAHQPPNIAINYDPLSLSCEFVRRCLRHENEGTTLKAIMDFQPDVLLLDFMDERFDLIQIGQSYLTYSEPVAASGLIAQLPDHRFVDRLSEEAHMIWTASAARFVRWVRHNLPHARHVLHQAPWAKVQVFGDRLGEAPHPSDSEQPITRHRSGKLSGYQKLIDWQHETYFRLAPSTFAVSAPTDTHVAARSHVWGPSPFHYVEEYYAAVARLLSGAGINLGIPGYVTTQSIRESPSHREAL